MSDDAVPRVVVAGHGLVVVPRIPFEIGCLASGDLVVVHHVGEVAPKLRLSASGEGVRFGLGPGTASVEDVVHDLEEDAALRGAPFVLDLDGATTIAWPSTMTVWSSDASWPVELTFGEAGDEMLYVQGTLDPSRLPALPLLAAPGMEIVTTETLRGAHGPAECIELAYVRDGVAWRQWRARVSRVDGLVALVTAQVALEGRAAMREALALVVESLVAIKPPPPGDVS